MTSEKDFAHLAFDTNGEIWIDGKANHPESACSSLLPGGFSIKDSTLCFSVGFELWEVDAYKRDTYEDAFNQTDMFHQDERPFTAVSKNIRHRGSAWLVTLENNEHIAGISVKNLYLGLKDEQQIGQAAQLFDMYYPDVNAGHKAFTSFQFEMNDVTGKYMLKMTPGDGKHLYLPCPAEDYGVFILPSSGIGMDVRLEFIDWLQHHVWNEKWLKKVTNSILPWPTVYEK